MMNRGACAAWWKLPVICGLTLVFGCGSDVTESTRTTSHEDIASFVEENPEFSASGQSASDDSELGLER